MKNTTQKTRALTQSIATTIAAISLSTAALAVDSATVPVGFIKEASSVAGSYLIHPSFLRSVPYQGASATIAAGSITVPVANPFPGGIATGHYAEDMATGARANITGGGGGTSISVTPDLGADGDVIRVVQHNTVASVFGAANTFGLYSDTNQQASDEVIIFTGSSAYSVYYNSTSADWLDSSSLPAGNTVISPDNGIILKKKTAGAVNVIATGTVKTGNTVITIQPGTNVIGITSVTKDQASLLTVGNSDLAPPVLTGDTTQQDADEVITFNGVTAYSVYYNTTAADWQDSSSLPAGGTALAPGSSIIIKHKTGPAVVWSQPAPASY